MNTLLLVYLVWLPLSTVFYSLVKKEDIKNKKKKALFWAVTLPSFWFFVSNEYVAKVISKSTVISKIAAWFKK